MKQVEINNLCRRDRRELDRCWRNKKKRTVVSYGFFYLSFCPDPKEEKKRLDGIDFIPAPEYRNLGKYSALPGQLSLTAIDAERSLPFPTMEIKTGDTSSFR